MGKAIVSCNVATDVLKGVNHFQLVAIMSKRVTGTKNNWARLTVSIFFHSQGYCGTMGIGILRRILRRGLFEGKDGPIF